MSSPLVLVLAFLIGVVAGLRSMTAPAVVAWAAHLGFISVAGTSLSFMGSMPTVVVLSLMALGELAVDKHPKAPSRTAPMGLVARIVLGGVSAATLAAATHRSLALGATCGVAGALVGTFGGYHARARAARALGRPFVAALLEDAVAVGGALLIVTRF